MTTMEIGKELVALCKLGKNQDAIDRLYSPNVESIEPCAMPGMEQTQRGIAKIKGKNQWWVDNHQIHEGTVDGPYPHGDRFILRFKYDVTPKHTGERNRPLHGSEWKNRQGGILLFHVASLKPSGGIDPAWLTC
jgi:hypothetical protein